MIKLDNNEQKIDNISILNENDYQYQFNDKEIIMILSDFLTLESYFSSQESAQMFEECAQKYGMDMIKKYIADGELTCRKIHIGPDAGKSLLWLTPKGREKAFLRPS